MAHFVFTHDFDKNVYRLA